MKIHIIRGTLEQVGDRSIRDDGSGPVTYSYLAFRTTDDEEVLVGQIAMPQVMGRVLHNGAEGVFVFVKHLLPKSREMQAVRAGDREVVQDYLIGFGAGDLLLAYARMFCLLITGVALCIVLIGLPIVLKTIWSMARYPYWINTLRGSLRAEGFSMAPVKTV